MGAAAIWIVGIVGTLAGAIAAIAAITNTNVEQVVFAKAQPPSVVVALVGVGDGEQDLPTAVGNIAVCGNGVSRNGEIASWVDVMHIEASGLSIVGLKG